MKRFSALALTLTLILTLASCAEEESTSSVALNSSSAQSVGSEPAQDYMTEDKIKDLSWIYDSLKADALNLINSRPADEYVDNADGGKDGYYLLLQENSVADYNLLGYQMSGDTERTNALTAADKKLKTLSLSYRFACENEDFALDCIKRDTDKMSKFTGVELTDTKRVFSNCPLDEQAYRAVAEGADLSLAINDQKSLNLNITCDKSDGVLYYYATVVVTFD